MAKILMYHGVDLCGKTSFNGRFISTVNFEKHLQFLKNNYNIISVAQAFEEDFINDNNSVCITFDDGYANNLYYAYPLVKKYGIPISIYVTPVCNSHLPILWADLVDMATDQLPQSFKIFSQSFYKDANGKFSDLKKFIKQNPVGGTEKFQLLFNTIFSQVPDFMQQPDLDDYWKLLSDEQIKILATDKLITIGSHGYWHNNLSNLDINTAKTEIDRSLTYLQNLTGAAVETLAFPDGAYNDELVNYCITKGVRQILGSHYSLSSGFSRSVLQHRIGIYACDDVKCLGEKLNVDEGSLVD